MFPVYFILEDEEPLEGLSSFCSAMNTDKQDMKVLTGKKAKRYTWWKEIIEFAKCCTLHIVGKGRPGTGRDIGEESVK